MFKSCGWGGWVWWVASKILETAQSPNSSFPFLFDFGLGFGTWDLDSGFSIGKSSFKSAWAVTNIYV